MGFRKENIQLIPDWFRGICSQIGIFKSFTKFMWKHLCWGHFSTMLHVSRPQTFFKIDFSPGIFLRLFSNFSKNLIYRTFPDDCSCWFCWAHCLLFHLFFSFIIDSCICRSLLRKCLRMKIFYSLQYFIQKLTNVAKTIFPRQRFANTH